MTIDHDWHQEALSDSSFGLGVSLVDHVSVIGETLAPLIDTTNAGPGDCYLATSGDLHLATIGDFSWPRTAGWWSRRPVTNEESWPTPRRLPRCCSTSWPSWPPIAYDDYSDHRQGWEVGSGSGIRHPLPPAPPKGTHDTTMRSCGMGHPPSTTIADAALRRILGSET
jgi:hypothetical protein